MTVVPFGSWYQHLNSWYPGGHHLHFRTYP